MEEINSRRHINNTGVTSAVHMFRKNFLSALGIQGNIVEHIPTEIELMRQETHLAEDLFILDDDSILHLEFQATSTYDGLVRLMDFDVLLYKQQLKKINTVVVFGPNVNEATTVADFGDVVYQVEPIYLNNIDGDRVVAELKGKVEQKYELVEEDLCRLLFLPYTKTSFERAKITGEALGILHFIADHEKKAIIQSYMINLAGKLLSNDELEEVLYVFKEIKA